MAASPRQLRVLRALLVAALVSVLAPLLLADRAEAKPGMQLGIEQFGHLEDPQYQALLLDTQKAYGAQVIRYTLRWDWVAKCNPTTRGNAADFRNACYEWGAVDSVVKNANARGMKVLLTVWGTPGYLFPGQAPQYVGGTDAQFNAFLTAYGNIVQAATTRFNGRSGLPRVEQWTMWNEPNGTFLTPHVVNSANVGAERYARLYDTGARRLKAVDATLQVSARPTAPLAKQIPAITFAQRVLQLLNSWGTPIDAWAHNAYVAGQSPFASTIKSPYVGLGNVHDLTNLMDQYGVTRGKPLWVTEFGYRTVGDVNGSIDISMHAKRTSEAMRYAYLQPRIATFIWYSLMDEQDANGFRSGLFHPLNQRCAGGALCPKPGGLMFRHTLWVSAANSKGVVTLWGQGRAKPDATRIFVQRPGDGWRAYANADTGATGTVEMQATLPNGTIVMTCDIYCGPQQRIASGGGSAGVYVKPKVVTKRLKTVKLKKRIALAKGMTNKFRCSTCKVTSVIQARGAASGIKAAKRRTIVVGRAKVTRAKRGTYRTAAKLAFTKAAKRELGTRKRATLVVRTAVTSGRTTTVYVQTIVLY